jgi:hypothetical protein
MNSRIQSADPTGWMQSDRRMDVLYRSREAVDTSSGPGQVTGDCLISLFHRVIASLTRIIDTLMSVLDPIHTISLHCEGKV